MPFILAGLCLLSTDPLRTDDQPPHIRWGEHVIYALEVPDPAAAARWYGQSLECELVLDLSDIGWCEVSTPVAGAVLGLGRPDPGQEPRDNGGSYISFEVQDIQSALALLRSRDVEVGEITVIPDTVKLLEVRDPWGNRLMLFESLGS